MVFTRRLREGIRRGRIRCTVRIWQRLHVKVGGCYPMDDGHVVYQNTPAALAALAGDARDAEGTGDTGDTAGDTAIERGYLAALRRHRTASAGAAATGAAAAEAGS